VRNVNLADAKAHLSKLVERAAAGDIVRIILSVVASQWLRSRRSKRHASGSISQRSAR
jgi:hypothetical protein